MIDTQAIRNKILDLAMRGQLTEQLPEDGTAEELYQQVQVEKQDLIKAGKIKKEKALPEISENDVPFEIPNNWAWLRWGNVSFQIQYGYNAPAQDKGRIKMVRITDIQNNKVLWKNVPYCDIDEDRIFEYRLYPNNILFARTGGTVGKSFLVEKVEEDAVFAGYLIRTSFSSSISAKYMKYFMESQLYWKQLQDGTTATAQPNCNAKTLSKMLVPLPPLAEQQRIVDKVDQAFSVLDTIDSLQTQYTDNLTALKAKLIDAAIQGKLTEQLPEDGTAEELYQQIQAEKQALIKAGKIKKEKPLPKISGNDVPFDIPTTWKWIRWGELSNQIQYGYNAPAKETGRIRMVRITDIQGNHVNWSTVPFCDIDEEDIEGYRVQPNDILFARTGGTVGKSYLVETVEEDAVFAGYLIRTSYSQDLNAKYMKYFMESRLYWKQLQDGTTATAQPNCNAKTLSKMMLPLPPKAEQYRIVESLDAIIKAIEA